jgi:hypothetical protein
LQAPAQRQPEAGDRTFDAQAAATTATAHDGERRCAGDLQRRRGQFEAGAMAKMMDDDGHASS